MDLSQPKTVVVPVDFSEPSYEALRSATSLTSELGVLHVVHVLPHLHPLDPALSVDMTDALRTQRAEASVSERLQAMGYDGVHVHVRIGNPGHEIVALAAELEADLIVVASHGYAGLTHLLLGSVAERVVRHASCPVLVVRQGRD